MKGKKCLDKKKVLKWLAKQRRESMREHLEDGWKWEKDVLTKTTKDGKSKEFYSSEVEYCHIAYGYQKVFEKIMNGDFDVKK